MPDDGRGYKRLGKSNSVLLQQMDQLTKEGVEKKNL